MYVSTRIRLNCNTDNLVLDRASHGTNQRLRHSRVRILGCGLSVSIDEKRHRCALWQGCIGTHSGICFQLDVSEQQHKLESTVKDLVLTPSARYFDVDSCNLELHAIRRHKWSSMIWTMSHLPFIMAYVLGSSGMAKLVLAVDTPNSHLDALTALYQQRAEAEVPMGIKWFYCVGFGMSLPRNSPSPIHADPHPVYRTRPNLHGDNLHFPPAQRNRDPPAQETLAPRRPLRRRLHNHLPALSREPELTATSWHGDRAACLLSGAGALGLELQ